MNKIVPLLAWRYLRQTAYEEGTSIMVKISFLGIFIGSFSLVLITAIFRGFEVTIHEKMQGINADAVIRADDREFLNAPAIEKELAKNYPMIESWAASGIEHLLIQSAKSDESGTMVVVKGIDPEAESRVTTLHSKIDPANAIIPSLPETIAHDKLLIGSGLAKNLGVQVGDSVRLFFTQDHAARDRKISLEQYEAEVGGTFTTGIDDFDNGIIFCSFDLLKKIFPQTGINAIHLRFKKKSNHEEIIHALRAQFNLSVYSWKELYKPLVAAMKLETYASFFILALVALVASMNMISLFFMQITHKRADIAILSSMGASSGTIASLFMSMGMVISGIACTFGIASACLVAYLLNRYPFIQLPDVYYVSHLPATIEPLVILLIFITVMLINCIALIIPIRQATKITIAKLLRFEG